MARSMSAASIANFPQMKRMNIMLIEPPSSSSSVKGPSLQPLHCTPLHEIEHQVEAKSMCEPCNGTGWLLCDFCNGQKTNVKSANNRIYRRCPSCKAIGCILCSKCKVFKCVTFPNFSDA
ncbi:hypothetical protein Vadar_016423 [Vaccinium darrowii]|uniref:Uncharacterized protein n=1 Tax=Vaccinium darrowii TaxID=229202 RepID=A0ACB7YX20_9ERIC|nr:hypothetical protein Vadar_016423 [Vaccinium darrowii]